VGSSQKPLLLNTGLADGSLRTADLPLYSLKNIRTGERIQTTDPGAAMKSGKWKDIGKFKVPSLRALETHSPYMHNGMSDDLQEILRFYDNRFSIGLTASEKADLEAFMEAL
jgi:cytochrome c peroxidase